VPKLLISSLKLWKNFWRGNGNKEVNFSWSKPAILIVSWCYVTRDGVTGDGDIRDDFYGDIGDDSPLGTATLGTTSLGTIT
jgi:hypothetical protein